MSGHNTYAYLATPNDVEVSKFLQDVTYVLCSMFEFGEIWGICSGLLNCDQTSGIKMIILMDSIGPCTGQCLGPKYLIFKLWPSDR